MYISKSVKNSDRTIFKLLKIIIISWPTSYFTLANISFKFYSIGSEFIKFGYENNKLFNVEKFIKNEANFE